jgi:biotin synthase
MDTALLIEKLNNTHSLNKDEALQLIKQGAQHKNLLFALAQETAHKSFGRQIFVRGLIEFTNYCKNDCYYCGIRRSNKNAARYRLTQEEILECCQAGYGFGFRTFVLQGGEDYFYSDEDIAAIVRAIKAQHPDCAVTLSIGERSRETYALWKKAGADRYLLRHETADCAHYAKLHPAELSAKNRQNCLYTLKELGYQAGAGFMVGSPYQTAENLADDLMFLQKLRPQMIGIGPFIPHHDTPFKDEPAGSVELTLVMLAVLRLLFPRVLLPATTALGTLAPGGRLLGIKAGANVIMPNLSPQNVRGKYLLYDNKLHTGAEAAEALNELQREVASIGYRIVSARGDYTEEPWTQG